jgi:translocation and assembly module TamB
VTEEKAQRGRAATATRRLGIGMAAVLVLIVGAVLGALGLAQTDYAKRRLAQWIEAESQGADGSGVAVGAIEGFIPFDVTLRQVALRDRLGVWLKVDSANLAISTADALRGLLVADALELSGVSVARAPAEEPQAAAAPLLPAALPRAPIQVVVKRLTAKGIDIAAAVLGVALRLDATGRAALAPFGESAVALTLTRQGDKPAETVLAARYAGGGRSARLALDARETGAGVFAALLDMPAVPALRLTLDLANDKALAGTLAADIDGRPLGDTPLGRALGADAKLAATVTVTANGDVAADDLRFTAAQLSLAGKGRLTDNARRVDAMLDYTLPDLAPASALIGAPVAGSVKGTLAARGALTQPTLDLRYEAGVLRYDAATVGALDGTATITGAFSDPTVALKAAARDLRQDQASIGQLDLEATVRRVLSDPSVDARFDARTLRQDRIAADRIAGTASAAKLLGAPNGRLDVAVTAPDLDARIATAYALDGRTLHLRDLSIRERGSAVTGTLDIGLDDFLLGGTVAGKVADLAPWSSLAGMKLAGALDLDARLAAAQGRQDAKIEARATRLSIRPAEGDAISAGTATLTADLRDVRGTPRGQARLALAGGAAGDIEIKSLEASAEGGESALKFRADAALKVDRDLTVSTTGAVARDKQSERLTLATLTGRYGTESFALARPLDLTRRGAALTLAPTSLTFGGGQVDLVGRLDGERVEAEMQIVRVPLKLAQLFDPQLALDGVAAGRLRVTGRPAAPEATLQLSADRLIIHNGGAPNMPRLSVRADGQARGGRLALKATIAGLPGQPFALAADLPLTLSAQPLAVALPAERPLKARLDGALDLAFLSSIVPVGEARLSGRADIALGVEGTLAKPRAAGTVTLADGRYENLVTGTLVDKIALRLVGDGSTVAIETLSATDGGSGRLSGTGRVALTSEGAGRAEARLRLDGFSALRLDEARATVSGNLALAGSPAEWRLGGKMQVDRADLQIPDRLPGRVVDLPVTFVSAGQPLPEEVNPAAKTPPEKPVEIALDVAVDAPARVFVRGRGLDSEWRGALKIGGTASEPQVTGTLSVVRGTLELLSKTFKLTRGTLAFTGTNVDNPDIDFVAETSAATITAQAHVTGNVKRPQIELTSSPPYPQDEILARVLFGKGSGQLTPLEAVQLAQAAASLTGTDTGPDITNFLRSATGLDVLRLEQGATTGGGAAGGATLKVGKYVADNVFVSVNQGLSAEETNVGVEIELTPNISVETSVGNVLGPKIGVNYKIDY